MYDLNRPTLKEMTETGSALRRLGHEARSMETVAERLVRLELFEPLALAAKLAVLAVL